jgi:hypothetical protein
MTHNEFNIDYDLFEPMKHFFIESYIITSVVVGNPMPLKVKFYLPPKMMLDNEKTEVKIELDKKLLQ